MSNLQNFEEILKSIDLESKRLKSALDAYQKLQDLTIAYDEINKQFDQNSKALDKINELQKIQQEKVAKSLTSIENVNKENKSELSKLLEEKIDQIRKENKEFYKELESTIKIKLDDNKSQIKQLIENERSNLKQIFEIEFAKNTKELRQVIETETNKQTQLLLDNQKTIKISLWILGGLTLILSAFVVLKLWKYI